MDINMTKHALNAGSSYVKEKVDTKKLGFLKVYFDVNNAYVRDKIFLIFYPFNCTFDFLFKPDLYIPLMSLFTLVVINAFKLGIKNEFHPEKLFMMISRYILIQIVSTFIYRGFGFLCKSNISFFSLLCFNGYKFLPILLVKIILFSGLKIFAILLGFYLLFVFFVFYSRSIRIECNKEPRSDINVIFVFGLAGIETLIMFFFMKF